MFDRAARRTVDSVKILCDLGVGLGSPLSSLLVGSGISPAQLGDPHLEIDSSQELQVIHNLVRLQAKTPGLGLLAGSRYHLGTYGIWGYALITSPSFRQAVDLGLKYIDLTFAFARISLTQHNNLAHLELDAHHLPPSVRAFVVERDFSAIQVLQRELFDQGLPLARVQLNFEPTTALAVYRDVFGCTPEFNAGVNRASFNDALLDLALPKGHEVNTRRCEHQLESLLAERCARGGMSAWVRNKLLADLSRSPGLSQIAKDHFMTERTLRRRLKEEGTSYRDLLNEVRQTMAEELLLSTGLSVAQVASRLGYASASAFNHAFQSWHQCSPGQFLDAAAEQVKHRKAR